MDELKAWLKSLADDDARESFALRCGTTLGHLRNVSYGQRPASPELCAALEFETEGQIECTLMRPDLPWVRLPDKAWPHPKGRPAVDVAKALPASA